MKKIAIFISMIFFIVGCSNDFINKIPLSSNTVEKVYQTDKDFQDAVIGCYQSIQSQLRDNYIYELASDDVHHSRTSAGNNVDLNEYLYNPSNSIFQSSWQGYYQAIYRVNYLLEKIEDKSEDVVVNKQRHIAETKFIRALAYLDLVRLWGDVPLITIVINYNEAPTMGRRPVNEIYEQIYADLIDAGNVLPQSYTGVDVGRATKGAAKAILGRTYLANKEFAKAEAILQEVTTMGYDLLPDYRDLFDYSKDEHHIEYIWDLEYEAGTTPTMGNSLTNECMPTWARLASFYGVVGGSRNDTYGPSDGLFTLFKDYDPRKEVTCAVGFTDNDGVYWAIADEAVGPQIAKAWTNKYMAPVPATGGGSSANWKVIRYADVLLMLAEALNENGKTVEAHKTLNKVIERSLPGEGVSGLSQADLREAIWEERRRELSFEGHRLYDLFRTGKFLEKCGPLGAKSHMILFPIPISEWQKMNNNEIFWQNPGWE
jgi:tetratricopeptide (TPR) repeat protein